VRGKDGEKSKRLAKRRGGGPKGAEPSRRIEGALPIYYGEEKRKRSAALAAAIA